MDKARKEVAAIRVKEFSKPIATVYETTKYDLFSRLPSNRIVSQARIAKLIASFGEKDVLNPIIVNEYLEIIDGQGRYEARKAMALPIYFVIAEGADDDDCGRLNRYNTKWSITNWVDSFCCHSDPEIAQNYKRIRQLHNESGLNYTNVLIACGINKWLKSSDTGISVIETGMLKVSEKEIQLGKIVIQHCTDLCTALCYERAATQPMFAAVRMMILTPGYNRETMLKNCSLQRSSFAAMATLKAQLEEFSRIYNYRKSRGQIYFEDALRKNVKTYRGRNYDVADASTLEVRS